jgi:hypothetical protein
MISSSFVAKVLCDIALCRNPGTASVFNISKKSVMPFPPTTYKAIFSRWNFEDLLVHMLTLCAKPSRSEVALAMAN